MQAALLATDGARGDAICQTEQKQRLGCEQADSDVDSTAAAAERLLLQLTVLGDVHHVRGVVSRRRRVGEGERQRRVGEQGQTRRQQDGRHVVGRVGDGQQARPRQLRDGDEDGRGAEVDGEGGCSRLQLTFWLLTGCGTGDGSEAFQLP